jgi:hypothetical protein
MCQAAVVEKIKTYFMFNNFFPLENGANYEMVAVKNTLYAVAC